VACRKYARGLQCVEDKRVFDRPLPYFHNGFASDLAAVVEFYDERFTIGSPRPRRPT
jgi:cytochrome c peroxidase